MAEWNQRTELLIGQEAAGRLAQSSVLVVGVGGVGAYAVEMLARAGVGQLTLVDGDRVGESNINRQLPALLSTLGQYKCDVLARRIADINPAAAVDVRNEFLDAPGLPALMKGGRPFDFVVDAIDSVGPKVSLIEYCMLHGQKIVSSMGAGGRMDPARVRISDLWETCNDGLARAVRARLKGDGMRRRLPVVWSDEPPLRQAVTFVDGMKGKRSSYGTISYMPAVFGCMLGAYVLRKLTGI